MSDEMLSFSWRVPSERWADAEPYIRKQANAELGEKLLAWLAEHGPAIVSAPRELITAGGHDYGMIEMTTIRIRLSLVPVGPLQDQEWFFIGGPLDGERRRTDGSPWIRIPIAGQPARIPLHLDDVHPERLLVALYYRDSGYYRFEGYER